MNWEDDNTEQPSFFKKHKIALLIGAGILVAVAVAISFIPQSTPKKKSSSVVSISLPPPPPPPLPPPLPPPPKEQPPEPDVQQEEAFQPEESVEAEPQAADPEPAPMGTNIEGTGNDGFGLAKGGGGGLIGGAGVGSGKKGSKYGAYAAQVQSSVVQALRSHKKTKSASLNVTARIWLDASGRVTRATLSGSSGDPATDAAIREEILTGLKFQAPPPDGMPMPIVMRLKATRPN